MGLLVDFCFFGASLSGADWPYFRGPNAVGVSSESGLPSRWSFAVKDGAVQSENVAWSADLPEWGNSSPVAVGERIYVTSQLEDETLWAIAIDRQSGSLAWKREVGRGMLKAHKLHNMATPTAAAEKDRLWALFGTGDLACLSRDGEILWKRNLPADHGEYKILWGMGSSPLLYKDHLIVICLHGGPSYVLALDKNTGRDAWKANRSLPAEGEAVDSYSSPVFQEVNGRTELIVSGADHLTAYDPESGKSLWLANGLKINHPYGRTMSSPGAENGIVVACSASIQALGTMIAVPAGGAGDISAAGPLWRYEKFTPDCPSPLCYRGYVYAIRDDGMTSCLEQKSGKLLWKDRLEGDFKASPVGGDGKVYFLNMDGQCTVVEAGPEKKVLSVNAVEGSAIATPAISDGAIFIRTRSRLYAIREPARRPVEAAPPAQAPSAAPPPAEEAPLYAGEAIFPPESWHNHSSCVVQCPDGGLLACWYHGSGERKADDVVVLGARQRAGATAWSPPFLLADTPGFPDTNCCMLVDPRGKLWLFWPVILANEWHTALMLYKVSSDYEGEGPPRWEEEKAMFLKPGDSFQAEVERALKELREKEGPRLAGLLVEKWLQEVEAKAKDKLSKRLGWMTRAHPVVIGGSRLIVPLYSDGFSFSLMAFSDDWGANWKTSAPLVGGGNVQPSVVEKSDGSLAAYMRDNGPPPKRILASESRDRGETWSPVIDTSLPNPGSGLEAIRLREGSWALVYNDTESGRRSLAVSLSPDEGKTWTWTKHLEPLPDFDGDRSASYPSIIHARDGTLHVTYSRKTSKGSTIYHARFNVAWVKAP
ncbi:MAG: exo-alpha-sialidase [Planctomycetes bacterium]|nr:exo-alpha-sialidase [Planctomycetota bacterium]